MTGKKEKSQNSELKLGSSVHGGDEKDEDGFEGVGRKASPGRGERDRELTGRVVA